MKNSTVLASVEDWNAFTVALRDEILKNKGPVVVRLRNGQAALVDFQKENGVTDDHDSFIEAATFRVWRLSGRSLQSSQLDMVAFDESTPEVPAPNSEWVHKNGNIYNVITVANLSADRKEEYPATVVYVGADGKVWSRPLTAWHGSMKPR